MGVASQDAVRSSVSRAQMDPRSGHGHESDVGQVRRPRDLGVAHRQCARPVREQSGRAGEYRADAKGEGEDVKK